MQESLRESRAARVSKSAEGLPRQSTSPPKRVTYKDQHDKHQRKVQRREKHSQKAYQVLKNVLAEKGFEDAETITAIETFAEKSCEAATYMIDKHEHEGADRVLGECTRVLKEEVRTQYPKLLYKVHYRHAELCNAIGQQQESLVYLRQAIAMAEEQEGMDGDPLGCMPADTYLNAAIAYQSAERLYEAQEAAQKANMAAKKALMALSEIQQTPKAFRQLTPQEVQAQLSIQLAVQIESHLVQGQVFDKMNRFEEALKVLQTGVKLTEQNLGPQYPLMADFQKAIQLVQMQIAPTMVDPKALQQTGGVVEHEVDLDPENVALLLDKRSELMKRGRVKRIYYQQTNEVQQADMRGEFADLEELEEKQAVETDRCAEVQSGWMQRQSLIAMRQQQDEQFRMMEILLATRQRSAEVNCNHPQVYLPMNYSYPVPQQQLVAENESSSSASVSTVGSGQAESTPRIRTPEPEPVVDKEPSSVSSQSDSFENNSQNMGTFKNYMSDDSDSDREAPPAFLDIEYDPVTLEGPKQVRSSGRDPTFKEKNFQSGITIKTKEIVVKPPSEKEPDIIVDAPSESSEHPQPIINVVDKDWLLLSKVIWVQYRMRRFLLLRRRRKDSEYFGLVINSFFVKTDQDLFMVTVYKSRVAHTIKTKVKQKERLRHRHRNEQEMHQVAEKVTELDQTKRTKEITMYQIEAEFVRRLGGHTIDYGKSYCLVNLLDFPAEFPFIIEYLQQALAFEFVEKQGRKFQVIFSKLSWEDQLKINVRMHQIKTEAFNRIARFNALVANEGASGQLDLGSATDTHSQYSKVEQFDYENVRKQIAEFEKEGHDMEALRYKIQWEARQILENNELSSSRVQKLVHRDIRKEREWKDYIRLNKPQRTIIKTEVRKKPSIYMIVKIQAMFRGFLARKKAPKPEVWTLIFDFIVHQKDNYYLVRVFQAPDSVFETTEYPYQVIVTRYLEPNDFYKLRLRQLPFPDETRTEDMIESIEILVKKDENGYMHSVRFKQLARQEVPPLQPAPSPSQSLPIETQVDLLEEMENEFIDDWEIPGSQRAGIFQIRRFRMLPFLIVSFSFYRDSDGEYFKIDVEQQLQVGPKTSAYLKLVQLPTELSYMVYFIRRHLKVYFKNEQEEGIKHVAFTGYQHRKAGKKQFEQEMKDLRQKIQRKERKEHEGKQAAGPDQVKSQEQIRDRADQERDLLDANQQEAQFELIQQGCVYNVRVYCNVPRGDGEVHPFRVLVFKSTDYNDRKYLNLSFINNEVNEREEFLKKHLRIYLSRQTNLIDYIALTKTEQPEQALPIDQIIKIQSRLRGLLVRRRLQLAPKENKEGFIARIFIDGQGGQRAKVTVWKTIVQRTVSTKKVQHTRERKQGQVVKEESKQTGQVEQKKTKIDAFEIEIENVYLPENKFNKIVTSIPDKSIIEDALREAIEIKWMGTYAHQYQANEQLVKKVDEIESFKYTRPDPELIQKLKRKHKLSQKKFKNFDSFLQRAGKGTYEWSNIVEVISGTLLLVLQQSDDIKSLDSPLYSISAHEKNEEGNFQMDYPVGSIVMTVKQVVQLLNRSVSEAEMAEKSVAELCESVSYSRTYSDWDLLLRRCCSLQSSTETILLDELTFLQNRYGFDTAQARTDSEYVDAAIKLQKVMRNFLKRKHHRKMMRTPGYAMTTGVYICNSVYLVYILRASSDMQQFFLTLKQVNEEGNREPIIERHQIPNDLVELAIVQHPGMYKLQSIQKVFEAKILQTRGKIILDAADQNPDWKNELVEAIKNNF